MKNFLRQPHFPLLSKELYEQALRPRTYWMRFLFGGLMLGLMCSSVYAFLNAYGNSPKIFGAGAEIYTTISQVELLVILLFLPAMVSGTIAGETEKKTLPLLLITDMRPWEILIQKLLGRMVPLLTILLLALPLGAIAYMFGGVSIEQVVTLVYLLVMVGALLGVICLWLSARCRTTVGAMVGCYVVGIPLFVAAFYGSFILGVLGVKVSQDAFGLWDGLFLEMHARSYFFPEISFGGRRSQLSMAMLIASFTLPMWPTTFLFFWLANRSLSRKLWPARQRAENTAGGTLPLLFRPRPLPGDEPVAWRQRYTRMGRKGRLTLTAITVIIGTVTAGMLLNPGDTVQFGGILARLGLGIWAFGSMLLVLQASSAFSAERSQDTLGILLTTPLSGRELLRQKMVLMRRWMKVIGVVLVVIALLQGWSYLATAGDPWYALLPPVTFMLAAIIYLPLLTWVGLLIGLCIASHDRATSTAITVIAAWLVGAMVFPLALLDAMGVPEGSVLRNVMLLSPATVLVEAEFGTLDEHLWGKPWLIVAVNFAFYAAMLRLVRRHLFEHADEYLGRAAHRRVEALVEAEPELLSNV